MTRCFGCVATLLLLLSCRQVNTNLVSDRAVAIDGGGIDGGPVAGADASAPFDAAFGDGGAVCGGGTCACDDGVDSDGDGLVDGFDPECTGPNDNDESSFATGAPNPPKACRDCFWDENARGGVSGCRYPAQCFTDPTFLGGPSCPSCVPSEGCVTSCLALTPSGCDCFGCCEVTREDGSKVEVQLADTCSLRALDIEAACPRCTRSTACQNPCDACELCPGKTLSDLPPSCGSTGVGHSCDNGLQICSASMPCQGTDYCRQGCCLLTVF